MSYFPDTSRIRKAKELLDKVIPQTPLQLSSYLSSKYKSNIYLKREDLQPVRSYKIRGAYNKLSSLSAEELAHKVVCASAGNHSQGFAYSCEKLGVYGEVFMPTTTPKQKINQVSWFGKDYVKIHLYGDSFDEANKAAKSFCAEQKAIFIHAFDDESIIEGQGTIAIEILEEFNDELDYLFLPIGGGGLMAGVGPYFNRLSPHTKIIGQEPQGAASMTESLAAGHIVRLDNIDTFVDGASVQEVGQLTFPICQKLLTAMELIPEGLVCSTILDLYTHSAIVLEPAGALSIACLDYYKEQIKGKNIVCIVSGGNNDITRMEEIKERAQLYEGLKHYFIIRFPQRAGALSDFVSDVLKNKEDITFFEYSKKNARITGQALVGIELVKKEDYEPLITRMRAQNVIFEHLNELPDLYNFIIKQK